jgi:hypothetical protein
MFLAGNTPSTSYRLYWIKPLGLGSAHCENAVVTAADTNAVGAGQILRGAIDGYETSQSVWLVVRKSHLVTRLYCRYGICTDERRARRRHSCR